MRWVRKEQSRASSSHASSRKSSQMSPAHGITLIFSIYFEFMNLGVCMVLCNALKLPIQRSGHLANA